YRLLHGRTGAVRWARGNRSQDARRHGPRAQKSGSSFGRESDEQGMIIGIGSDLIDIRRVAKVIERHRDRFVERIFTKAVRAKSGRRAKNEKMVVATYAKRFAAKEACSKALGTGIRRGVWWRDMGVVNLPGGSPTMIVRGWALGGLQALTLQVIEPGIDHSNNDVLPEAQAVILFTAHTPVIRW